MQYNLISVFYDIHGLVSKKFLFVYFWGNFHRHDQDQEVQSKIATIEDLHSRLKLNIDNIQQLNQQVPNFWITFKFRNVNILILFWLIH